MSASGTPRIAIWIPIVHTQADLGSMSEAVRELYVHKLGKEKWEEHRRAIDAMWDEIGREIERLNLNYPSVRLYQDGLPNCGHEEQIVRDLAPIGSRNHALLLTLMEKGARLTGTESPELLLEEYELARRSLITIANSRSSRNSASQRELSRKILDRRDEYIANRISQTLEPGFTGLVFLGVLHSLEGRLPRDITLRRLNMRG